MKLPDLPNTGNRTRIYCIATSWLLDAPSVNNIFQIIHSDLRSLCHWLRIYFEECSINSFRGLRPLAEKRHALLTQQAVQIFHLLSSLLLR